MSGAGETREQAPGRRLKLLSYNILDGGVGRDTWIREILTQQAADMVLLQEVTNEGLFQGWASALSGNGLIARGRGKHSLGLITRLPLLEFKSVHPVPLRHPLLYARLNDSSGQTLDVIGVHLAAPAFNLPLELYRLRELDVVLKWIDTLGYTRAIVAGDFNSIAPGDSPNFHILPGWLRLSIFMQGGYIARQVIARMRAAGWLDAYRRVHPDDPGYTLPALAPNSRLDYIFVNDAVYRQVRACEVVRCPDVVRRASDHLPVAIEIEI